MNIYSDKREDDQFILSSFVAMRKFEERGVLNFFEQMIKVS
jgi:hypothetical protein